MFYGYHLNGKTGPEAAAHSKALMQQGAMSSAKTAAKAHRDKVEWAKTAHLKPDYGSAEAEAVVKEILRLGERLDQCIKSCLMHGIPRQVIAKELEEWLSPSYVEDLTDPLDRGF